jgi:hypothetical protein
MRTVWKFRLDVIVNDQRLIMPGSGEVLAVGVQDRSIVLWVLVCPDHANETRVFRVLGTGHRVTSDVKAHVGTVQIGVYVWHVFEVDANAIEEVDSGEETGGEEVG